MATEIEKMPVGIHLGKTPKVTNFSTIVLDPVTDHTLEFRIFTNLEIC